jgi:hypothetical protein
MNNLLPIVYHLHIFSTLAMTGIIWFVQIVHYPLFRDVETSGFKRFEAGHSTRTSYLVAPLMVLEAGCAIALVLLLTNRPAVWMGLGLLGVVWLSTFLLQVPQHRRLSHGFDPVAHRRLIRTNWIRTAAWTLRALLALYLASGSTR